MRKKILAACIQYVFFLLFNIKHDAIIYMRDSKLMDLSWTASFAVHWQNKIVVFESKLIVYLFCRRAFQAESDNREDHGLLHHALAIEGRGRDPGMSLQTPHHYWQKSGESL